MTTRLLDAGWRMRAVGGLAHLPKAQSALKRWLPAQVPGTVQHQLMALGRIPDPYHDRNELDLQWLDRLDWELETTLTAEAADCARARQELLFDGIDTIAEIRLNGRVVGRSVNMFRQVVCDVRGILKPGRNILSVRIASPTTWCTAASAQHGDPLLPHDWKWQTGEARPMHRAWIRKVGCHFGWDWGVCLPPSGIWRAVRLETSDAPRIAAVTVAQTHRGPVGAPTAVELAVTVRLAHPAACTGAVTVAIDGQTVTVPVQGGLTATATITIANPRLWWPAGSGAQPLYDLDVAWQGEAPTRRRIGLRTIAVATEADTTPDGKPAEGFAFVVNGRRIWCKGANWIPADQFIDRCTPSVYRHLLEGMVETHQNMIRVWGGGWYEEDVFYDLCDELGLLVWQDMMMACQLHPVTPDFLAELSAEVSENVERLQHRASIALWCGDNENHGGVMWWGWDKRMGRTRDEVLAHYTALMTPVRDAVQAADPTRRFWVSSPSNGWIDQDPCSHDRGDEHMWRVWHGQQPFSFYRTVKPRFCSEFGFQAFPEPRTVATCIPAGSRNPSGWSMEHHQRAPGGNQLITNTIARELPIWKDLDGYLWMSQANQAEAIRTAVEHWRRNQPWCMGALYWQINDLWPVASWSSIDYHGRWKALHHAAGRFFAPLLVSILPENERLQVWATSDLPRALPLRGHLDLVHVGGKRLKRIPLRGDLPADGNQRLCDLAEGDVLPRGVHRREVVAIARLAGGGQRGRSVMPLVPWKHVPLADPRPRTRVVRDGDGVAVAIDVRAVAPYVHAWIEGTESHLAGDWDTLVPGETTRLRVVPHQHRGQRAITAADAKRRLRVESLWDWSMRE